MKPLLYNKLDKRVLKETIMKDKTARTTYAFYRYLPLVDLTELRDTLYLELSRLGVLGRIYLATEGINAQFSLPNVSQAAFKVLAERLAVLRAAKVQTALVEGSPAFHKLTIKIRPQLVATGLPDTATALQHRGKHLSPREFTMAMDEAESIVMDVRNHYEYEVGHFDDALCLPADTFRELLPALLLKLKGQQHRKVLLYCTGGIRCETASAYLKLNGFSETYQLQGGIIGYVHAQRSEGLPLRFKGKNFVFDNRLGERVSDHVLATCHQCGAPADEHTNCKNDACHLLFIQCVSCRAHFTGCCSLSCKMEANLPLPEQRRLRRGAPRPHAHAVHKARRARGRLTARAGLAS